MSTTAWRWFPFGLAAAMSVAFAVNGYMVYDAVSTFPGAAGEDGFDLSNGYGKVLQAQDHQAAIGWQVQTEVNAAHYPVLRLTDRTGAPLPQAEITAQAERPVGPKETTPLTFRRADASLYQAGTSLFSGQWDILLTIRASDQIYTTTSRVVVR